MTADATWAQRLRRMAVENLGLKLFSLLVSIGLFTVVHGAEVGQRSLYVPVMALLPPESASKVLVGELPDRVKVTLSGSRSVLNSINSVDAVQIDLREAPKHFQFGADAFGFPAGIQVEVTPASLLLDWEARFERSLSIRAQWTGVPDPALDMVGKPVVTPARVTVKGPRSRVDGLREVLTEPIALGDLGAGSHRRRVSILPLPAQVFAVEGQEVTVEISLEARKEKRRLRRLPVAALGVRDPIVVRPVHVDVLVSGPERILKELDPEHVVPVIELGDVSLGSETVSVPVKLRGIDESLRALRIEPAEVLVRRK